MRGYAEKRKEETEKEMFFATLIPYCFLMHFEINIKYIVNYKFINFKLIQMITDFRYKLSEIKYKNAFTVIF